LALPMPRSATTAEPYPSPTVVDHWSRLEYIASILPPQPTRAKVSRLVIVRCCCCCCC
jgi:hypothetical protein